ncbi:MAG: DUF1343 domain-containing protein [Candidatus Eremiobacteraeota bacterium]|nr:DUF1343 domain-containing protein [Candidatus Eremiobacteraeota bacterium]MBV8498261.1 DUF1343 domain-containing protein [Candidatus Eremiobacteraeota bacterium]
MNRGSFIAGGAALTVATAAASAQQLAPTPVELGDDVLLSGGAWRDLRGRAVGVIANQSGVTSAQESIVDAILHHGKIRIKAIYAPEHGFRGDQAAGATIASYVDSRTGLPVYSLYGATRHPSAAMLEGVEVLLFDIQDVGSRAYTYISTMAYAMQSAAAYGKEFWVLDRPNPTGGSIVEAPVLEPPYESFIGLYPIAMRHGMTVGELAHLFNEHFGIGAKLRVVGMNGWRRSMIWPDTGLQWVQTSPNIPTWETTIVYPGMGLVDTVGVNNGSGFTNPFLLAGMAGIDGPALAEHLNARALPGIAFRPTQWSPTSGFWQGRVLTGVELELLEPRRILAVRTALEILVAVRDLFPRVIRIKSVAALDRDWGTDSFRQAFLAGESAEAIVARWAPSVNSFRALRERYLLY